MQCETSTTRLLSPLSESASLFSVALFSLILALDFPMLPLEELWMVVRRIPKGRAASYGEIGRALKNPASGYFVGRWMAQCPADVPWWRVVAKDGHLPLAKRSPEYAAEQLRRLQQEDVKIEDGRVSPSVLVTFSDLLVD